MAEETELETVETEDVKPMIVSQGLLTEDVIKKAELQVNGLNKIKEISLKITNKSDWVVMNGKPCLGNSGCMKISNLWGVSFHKPVIKEEKRTDDRGEYITFTCEGEGEFRGRVINDIGTSSTRDKLLGTVGGNLKELSAVDLPSIKKMSVTNWQSRILKKILGLSFEMGDLQAKGIEPSNNVNHAGGGAGGGKVSQPQINRLLAIGKSVRKSVDQIDAYIKTKYGYESKSDIERSKYEEICKWASEVSDEQH